MTTTAVSTIRTLTLAGIGPVELTVEDRGDRQHFSLAAWRRRSTVGRRIRPVACRKEPHPVLTPIHPGFGGTSRPDELNSVPRLAVLTAACSKSSDSRT
jgi:hypothetical protein